MMRWIPGLAVAFLALASIAPAAPLRLDSQTLEPTTANGVALAELLAAAPEDAGRHVLVQVRRVPGQTR